MNHKNHYLKEIQIRANLFENQNFDLYYHFCTESMIGCAYSHLKVLETFLKTNRQIV